MSNCKYCLRVFSNSNSLLNHEHRCKENPQPKGFKFTKDFAKTFSHKRNTEAIVLHAKKRKLLDKDVFVENSNYARQHIKKRIIEQKLINYECSSCGNNGSHNGKELILQLDHINGTNNDHRIENLRFLCPNCHSQQDTYAAKNMKRKNTV